MMNARIKELIQTIPKAENHIHLEGGIQYELILKFAKRNNVELPFTTIEGARDYIVDKTSSLDTFIEVYNLIGSVIRTEEDLYEMVVEHAKDAKRQNIIYRETMISFAVHEEKGLSTETIVKGISEGRKEALEKYGVDIRFIAEVDRSKDGVWSKDYVNRVKPFKDSAPIVGVGWELGLEGHEEDNNLAEEFVEAFKLAKEYGFKTSAHCGEVQGPESIWNVLDNLGVDRIDHGVQANRDDKLVAYLADKKIPLTVCPSTNVICNLFASYEDHPFNALRNKGVAVTLNSDDPAFIVGDLIGEFMHVAEAYEYTEKDIIEIARDSFKYSFAGQKYLEEFDAWAEKWEKSSK
jgi:adenosine deaminase